MQDIGFELRRSQDPFVTDRFATCAQRWAMYMAMNGTRCSTRTGVKTLAIGDRPLAFSLCVGTVQVDFVGRVP